MPQALYQHSQFIKAATRLEQCPDDTGNEVAVVGRSNAGKSSVVNTICGRRALARVSRSPGRTRELLFFELQPARRLVDLPGYGFAKAPAAQTQQWPAMIESYFAGRASLRGVLIVMDCRHPLQSLDEYMLNFCAELGLPAHVLLNKADKLAHGKAKQCLMDIRSRLPADVSVDLLSCLKQTGQDALRDRLERWLTNPNELADARADAGPPASQ